MCTKVETSLRIVVSCVAATWCSCSDSTPQLLTWKFCRDVNMIRIKCTHSNTPWFAEISTLYSGDWAEVQCPGCVTGWLQSGWKLMSSSKMTRGCDFQWDDDVTGSRSSMFVGTGGVFTLCAWEGAGVGRGTNKKTALTFGLLGRGGQEWGRAGWRDTP